MKHERVTEDTIRELVGGFYAKVRKDPDLGPIFTAMIGDSAEAWQPHLQKMYDFWSSVMLATSRYDGTPMRKHKELPPFDPALFGRWLALFAETAQEIHTGPIAAIYIEKSRRIAESLKLGIYGLPGK
jgi:hemoglobin